MVASGMYCGNSPDYSPPYIDPNMAGMLWDGDKKEERREVGRY